MTIDWSELLQPLDGDPDAQFQLFSKTLEKAVSACVPCYKNKKNITELKWIKLLENWFGGNLVYGYATWKPKMLQNMMNIANVEIKYKTKYSKNLWKTNSIKHSDRTKTFLEICKFKAEMQKHYSGPLLIIGPQICHWYWWAESWSFVKNFCKCLHWYFWWWRCFIRTSEEKSITWNGANINQYWISL